MSHSKIPNTRPELNKMYFCLIKSGESELTKQRADTRTLQQTAGCPNQATEFTVTGSLDLSGTMDKGVQLRLQGTCTLTQGGWEGAETVARAWRTPSVAADALPAWAAGDPAAGRTGRGPAPSTAGLPPVAKG